MANKNEIVAVTESGYMVESMDLGSYGEEMAGMTPTFDKVKIPSGGGLAYEVPGDDPDSPDMTKEFSGVVVFHHPMNVYYRDKFDGSSNPPDCSSADGKFGMSIEDGEIIECAKCENSKFGSADDGKGKACKQKRRLFVLRENEMLPLILTLPTGSLQEFTSYVMRLIKKGKKTSDVVTKFSLKKVQNKNGITYSQAVFAVDRDLTPQEKASTSKMTEQIRAIATSLAQADAE